MGKIVMKFLKTVVFALVVMIGPIDLSEQWWEHAHIYQIFPLSFQDTDGNRFGDLKGIMQHLPYLKSLGATSIWLQPIYPSPLGDTGYDITDYKNINPLLGTLADFDEMIANCRKLNIKVILDYVPNHTSSQHPWFKASANPNDPKHQQYKDYYIWNKGIQLENGTRAPPSNWLNNLNGSAWQWIESRQEYNFHQFFPFQVDLNYRNPTVVCEMDGVLRFWMDRGVDGFRIDAISFLYEVAANSDGTYPNEPAAAPSPSCNTPEAYCLLDHIYTYDQPESFEMVYHWRQVLDDYQENEGGPTRILMTESYSSTPTILRYYGKINARGRVIQYGAQVPFFLDFVPQTPVKALYYKQDQTAYTFEKVISDYLSELPFGKRIIPNWQTSNHDNPRSASRYDPQRIDLFNILSKTLPGITMTYYGEEIGMTDVAISYADTFDNLGCKTNPEVYQYSSRDPERTPMQWNFCKNSGFSTANKTWIPVANNYTECNVELQKSQPISHLHVFRQLIQLRKNPTIKHGDLEIKAINKDVLVYKRQINKYSKHATTKCIAKKPDVFVIILNLGSADETVCVSCIFGRHVSRQMEVMVASIQSTTLIPGTIVNTKQVVVNPNVGVVLKGLC